MTLCHQLELTYRDTAEAIARPKPGDVFQEMYSFWVGIVAVDGDRVTFVAKSGHPRGPHRARVRTWPRARLRDRYLRHMLLARRGDDPSDWLRPRREEET